ncbi:MAG: WhiB family transcriptional regulator [Actinomycetota bacterium]|nr:WhiB family transcriptional regulator [Actinomycetota bacterium]
MTRRRYRSSTPDTATPAARWSSKALCQAVSDPDVFFPTGIGAGVQQQIDDVKAICTHCPVQLACAVAAVTGGWADGIWGGLDEGERRYLIRSQPADIEKAIRDRLAARRLDPYFEAYARRTEQEDGGHVRWLGKNNPVTIRGRTYSPVQLALHLARGRDAHGITKTTCGRAYCVAPEHVADDIVRWDRSRDRYEATA